MLKKRLIGVVTVKKGWAVQSFGYRRYLPLGKPECLVENLDRWGTDEILVQVIDRSPSNIGPDFELIDRLGKLGLGTPLIYAGGIRSLADGIRLIQLGADRVVVDALVHEDISIIEELSERLGAQALIASLPLSWQEESLWWYDYRKQLIQPISDDVREMVQAGVVSEVLITDWQHEGKAEGFDQRLVDHLPLNDVPVIAFGGISSAQQMHELLQLPAVVAVAAGNFLSYKEQATQAFKENLPGTPLRLATYHSKFSLIADV
jgi:cyclase